MSIRNLIILSQLNPPSQQARVLHRDRLVSKLTNSLKYPLTILEAGTGYGKTTTILSFLEMVDVESFWFSVSGSDRDPRLFLAKLFTAFNQNGSEIGDAALQVLEMSDGTTEEALIAFINALSSSLKKDALFIIDDFHRVSDVSAIISQLDWLLDKLPRHLHIMISTRHNPQFSTINEWRVKGKVLEIGKCDLIFNIEEAKILFSELYGLALSDLSVKQILEKTEGWAIGLQMIWQTICNNPDLSIDQVLEEKKQSRTALFEYLAEDIIAKLPENYQNFLFQTALLSKMDSLTCDFLLNMDKSENYLSQLEKKGLFIEELRPGVYRYHQIFREFLLSRLKLDPKDEKKLHRKIASYFQAHEYWEEALYHLINAKDYQQINQILETIGEDFIQTGRQESIYYWISEIPEVNRRKFPYLLFLVGEVQRYWGKFDEALEYYHSAERLYRKQDDAYGISKTYRGQAQVFLDTIRPTSANQLLQESLSMLDPNEMPLEVAELLVLTAENQLNLGYSDSAQTLLNKAKGLNNQMDRDADLIQARIYLRTGQIQKGITLLQSLENNIPNSRPSRPQRFHRESTLLLSLFHTLKGEIEESEHYARLGIKIAELLQSTFVFSVGMMRLGHSILLRSQYPFSSNGLHKAIILYKEAIDKVDIVRIHAEPLWGMCRALGYTNQIEEAKQMAGKSLQIVKNAGDQWMGSLIQLSIGAGAVQCNEYDVAQGYLIEAEATAIKVKDPLVVCVARLWLAIKAWKQGFANTAFGYLEKALRAITVYDYDFLLNNQTFMGLSDPEMIYPLLLKAYENDVMRETIKTLLSKRGLCSINYFPGYSLWVRTLGGFKLWRGDEEIEPQQWKREKSRQLFQLLVANRNRWIHRDLIVNVLWGNQSIENSDNYLKVVLSTLNQVLEPDRPKGSTSFFVERQQNRYRLNPNARIIADIDIFNQEITKNTSYSLERAIDLYQGRFFSGNYIQEWLSIDEQYYHQQFMLAAEKLADLKIEAGQYEEALEVTHKMLREDHLYEPSYRLQMTIFHRMGKLSLVKESYQHCIEVFREELGSQVSSLTRKHFETLISESSDPH